MSRSLALLEEALRHSTLNEPAKESLRQRMQSAEVEAVMDGARAARERARREYERGVASVIGGTDADESDVPREVGSRTGSRMRPGAEGLTAGARWLEDWRLP